MLRALDGIDPHALEVRIDAAWDVLTYALEEGEITPSQLRIVERMEEQLGDGDNPASRLVFALYIAQAAKYPTMIGQRIHDLTYQCASCEDNGIVVDGDVGVPCPSCNFDAYELWRNGHFKPNHSCATCDPTKRPRGRAGASDREEARENSAYMAAQRDRADLF